MKYTTIVLKENDIRDFSRARNEVLARAKGEWVLFLDSDESLSPELVTEIKNLKPEACVNGFLIPRQGIVQERLLRLGRKNAGLWHRKVHETWDIKAQVGVLKNPILHKPEKNLLEK